MSTKARIQKLESTKPQVKITWKDFIDWTNGKVFDKDTEALLQKEWCEVIAKDEAAHTSQNTRA